MIQELLKCDFEGAKWLLFGPNATTIVYYSHLPIILISIFLAFFVLIQNKKSIVNNVLFYTIMAFVVWVFSDSVYWASNQSDMIMFVWTTIIVIEPFVYLGAFYLLYTLITKKDLPFSGKLFLGVLYMPLIILGPSEYILKSFDITTCLANEAYFSYYTYVIEVCIILAILLFTIREYRKAVIVEKKKEIILLTTGIILFLGAFAWGNITGSLTDNWDLAQYGLFGMPIFTGFLVYSIVKFKAFDIKLLGAQALVWALIIIIGAEFVFVESDINRILIAVTLIISAVVGLIIVRSVKKEVAQREHIEQLATSLEASNQKMEVANESLEEANEKLKELDLMKSEFVSLATHQIRGPLAAMKGYISLIEEGDYGKVPKALDEPLQTIFTSTDSLSRMVTDFLDVSRIDLGQMKYEFTDFDFRELVEEVTKELKPNIDAKGLELRVKITKDPCPVKADHTKLKQVLNNLIDNSSKYTKTGWMEVSVEKKGDKILFAVKDSGVGISKITLSQLFQRFTRAKDANKTNILGTGLGLYIAKKMVEANNGRVWAESEGDGKGAQFYVELPSL